jgi:phosphatidylglycerophosphate synthase
MLRYFRTIPNQITGVRLLLIPALWIFAFMKLPHYVGAGMIVAALTDALDGFMA